MKFGDILRQLLEEHGKSQKEAAKELNIAVSTLGNYVRNIREPDYETLKSIASYFHVNCDYLLDFRGRDKISHEEAHLLHLFRALDPQQQELFIEQGALLLRHSEKKKESFMSTSV